MALSDGEKVQIEEQLVMELTRSDYEWSLRMAWDDYKREGFLPPQGSDRRAFVERMRKETGR